MAEIVLMFARGLSDAQLKVGGCSSPGAAILETSTRRPGGRSWQWGGI